MVLSFLVWSFLYKIPYISWCLQTMSQSFLLNRSLKSAYRNITTKKKKKVINPTSGVRHFILSCLKMLHCTKDSQFWSPSWNGMLKREWRSVVSLNRCGHISRRNNLSSEQMYFAQSSAKKIKSYLNFRCSQK